MLWRYTDFPPEPYKLYIVEADYRNLGKHPSYEFVAKSKRGIKKYFEEAFGLKVFNIKEAPQDYEPNKWFIKKHKRRNDFNA